MSLGARSSDTDSGSFSEVTEECNECERQTTHEVRVHLRTENPDSTFSREPYRIAECQFCGQTEEVRMNNA